MKSALLIAAALVLFASCKVVNQTRKGAGISRQYLFTDSTMDAAGIKKKEIQPTLFWSHYDATQRGGLYMVVPEPGGQYKVQVISENPPDAAISSSIDALAKAKVGDKVDAEAKFAAVRSVAELGQRNAGNYMIRDIAFRIEALQNNGGIDDKVIALYKELIKSGESISIAHAQTDASKAKVELLKEINLFLLKGDTTNQKPRLDSMLLVIQHVLHNK